MSEFELITAVLAGSRHLEIRIFSDCPVSSLTECDLTHQLCNTMSRQELQWRR